MSRSRLLEMSGAAVAAVALIAGATLSGALAADLSAPPPMEAPAAEPVVEWGSGWYLRGDIGPHQDLGVAASATETARKRTGVEMSLGAGYVFNNWFRMDATYERFGDRKRSGAAGTVVCPYSAQGLSNQVTGMAVGMAYDVNDTCNVTTNSRLGVQGGLINAYADLGKFGMITPYVGAGVGAFLHRASASTNYFKTTDGTPYAPDLTPAGGFPLVWINPITGKQAINPATGAYPNIPFAKQTWDKKLLRNTTSFGFALMAGVGVDLAEGLKLDVGYRYLNAGSFKALADPATGKTKTYNLDSHQFKIGLRYQID